MLALLLNVLNNKASQAQKNVVIINSAYALKLIKNNSLEDCILESTEAIESLKALNTFKQLLNKKYEYAR